MTPNYLSFSVYLGTIFIIPAIIHKYQKSILSKLDQTINEVVFPIFGNSSLYPELGAINLYTNLKNNYMLIFMIPMIAVSIIVFLRTILQKCDLDNINIIYKIKDKCILKVADSLLSTQYKTCLKAQQLFKESKSTLLTMIEEMEVALDHSCEKGSSIYEMIEIFKKYKDPVNLNKNTAVKECRKVIDACFSYSSKAAWFYLFLHNFEKLRKNSENLNQIKLSYIKELSSLFLPSIFDSKDQIDKDEFIQYLSNWNPEFLDPYENQVSLKVNRLFLKSHPKKYLAKLLRMQTFEPLSNKVSFKIEGEPARDVGGVTREVLTILFSSIFETSDGKIRPILNLGAHLYIYKGLGIALALVSSNNTLFLKNYFDEYIFNSIDSLSARDLKSLNENQNKALVERIKQKLILQLHKKDGPYLIDGLKMIFAFKAKEKPTEEDYNHLQAFIEDTLGYENDLDEMKEINLKSYQKTIEDVVNNWLETFYMEVDKFIALSIFMKGAPPSSGAELSFPISFQRGTNTLEKLVSPLDRQGLAKAIVAGALDSLSKKEEKKCIRQKIKLIKDWVRNKATDKNLHDFIAFCTGSAVLGKDQTIKISYSHGPAFFAQTCFSRLDLSTTFEQMKDPKNRSYKKVHKAFIRDLNYVIMEGSDALFNHA